MSDETVDILVPPAFNKSGATKTKGQAYKDGDWVGIFHLWIVRSKPVPAILYQKRSSKAIYAPSLLDVTAGGHYHSGESLYDGLREVEEELGKRYNKSDLTSLGKKLFFGYDEKGRMKHNVVDVFMTIDNSPLQSFKLDPKEVEGLYLCPIEDLKKLFTRKNYSFTVSGITQTNKLQTTKVTYNSFPFNWDNYHLKIAILADRLLKGEKNLLI